VTTPDLCLTRQKSGRGFRYLDADSRPIRSRRTLDRMRALAIPPAWTEVCIAVRGRGARDGADARRGAQRLERSGNCFDAAA